MKKYLVRFTTKSGDYDKEWCEDNGYDYELVEPDDNN